jgi:hypothetical protein
MFVGTTFGLTPTPAVLQRTMATIFHDFPRTLPFQGDVIIGSDNDTEHLHDVIAAIESNHSGEFSVRDNQVSLFQAHSLRP